MSPLPKTLADIPTPALIVDLAAMERNIRRMADFFSHGSCRLRPHFKAHKTPEIARRQLAAGSCTGLTCATVWEAEVASAFCDDLLIANEVIGARSCARVAALAHRASVTLAVDSATGTADISEAARRAGVTVGVLVDVNVGQNRCGVQPAPHDDALSLARRVVDSPSLRLRGLMGYEGHAVGIAARQQREEAVRHSMSLLARTVYAFRDHGLPTETVSAGGTGSYDISSTFPEITEIQAGSYALMDTHYGRQGLPFEYASFVMGTILSRPDAHRAVADCGHKSCTTDHGYPAVRDIADARVVALNDEHAIIELPATSSIQVGDRLFLIPSHTDPTLNLHDVVYAIGNEDVVGVWPVAARGYQ